MCKIDTLKNLGQNPAIKDYISFRPFSRVLQKIANFMMPYLF